MSGHNNPVKIAKWECSRINPALPDPDIILSIGTGASTSPKPGLFRHTFPGFVVRLCDGFKNTFDCEKQSEEFLNSLDEKRRESFFRLNVFFSGDKLAIDACDRMPEMRERVRQSLAIHECDGVLYAILVSSFYFELKAPPKKIRGDLYQCCGTIRCRLRGDTFVDLLALIHPSSLGFSTGTRDLGSYDGVGDLCPTCRRYQKEVEFTIRHPTELVTISVQSMTRGRQKISAFPQSIQWFVDQQHLETVFGNPFHRDLQDRSCKSCTPKTTNYNSCLLKRLASGNLEQPPTKKHRL
jgi:hypothetical protein